MKAAQLKERDMKLSSAQFVALGLVARHSEGGTYMPDRAMQLVFEACERKGLLAYRSVSDGSKYNGYALTDLGRSELAKPKRAL
jgi:hypothetical protein